MSNGSSDASGYEVQLTDEAFYSYASLEPNRLFDHVTHDLELLESNPSIGLVYDPVYEAQVPPFECRVLFCEYLGIYCRLDESRKLVLIIAIVDQRRDPDNRFA